MNKYWEESDSLYLKKILKNNSTRYSLPSFDEVMEAIKDDSLFEETGSGSEIVMDDLIIRFEDNEISLC